MQLAEKRAIARKKAEEPRPPAKMTVSPGRWGGPNRHHKAMLRSVIADFEEKGWSSHSANATMLQMLIDYCDEKGYSYAVSKLGGHGWAIQRFRFPAEVMTVTPSVQNFGITDAQRLGWLLAHPGAILDPPGKDALNNLHAVFFVQDDEDCRALGEDFREAIDNAIRGDFVRR